MARNIIACRTGSYGKFEAIALSHLAQVGLKHVEMLVPEAAKLAAAQADLAQHGLSASSLHGKCDVQSATCAAEVEAQMPAFKALGTRYMFVSCKAGEVPLDTVYGRLREAGQVAAAHGVTIIMETHPDLITNAEVALTTMRGVTPPNVRINYDTANIYFYNEGVDGVAELRKCLEYVGALHLKETNGKYRSWHFPALGRGVVKFPEIFALLDKANFGGPCTLEVEGSEGEEQTERRVCDRIAESVGYLRGLGRL